jgi:hypothetical protein
MKSFYRKKLSYKVYTLTKQPKMSNFHFGDRVHDVSGEVQKFSGEVQNNLRHAPPHSSPQNPVTFYIIFVCFNLLRKPETCNSSSFSSMTTMKALTRKSQQSKCESGAVIYFKHPVDLELREKLSVVSHSDVVIPLGRFTLHNFCLNLCLSHATCLQLVSYCVNQAHNSLTVYCCTY